MISIFKGFRERRLKKQQAAERVAKALLPETDIEFFKRQLENALKHGHVDPVNGIIKVDPSYAVAYDNLSPEERSEVFRNFCGRNRMISYDKNSVVYWGKLPNEKKKK